MTVFRRILLVAGVLSAAGPLAACDSSSPDQADPDLAVTESADSESVGCPSDEEISRYLADWRERRPNIPLAEGGTLEDALCSQDKLLRQHTDSLGGRVGYKAGLTSLAAQETFGVSEPVRGVLLEGMLLDDGAEVPADFGARPRFEADMIFVVGDAAINQATTIEEVQSHLVQAMPFIELPDLSVAEGETLDGVVLTAINVASRLGVVGDPVPVQQTPAFLQALADMDVSLVDQDGAVLVSSPGSAILEHPLNSVLWLIRNGVRMDEGDYVSVGSFGPLLVPEAGRTITVRYDGLPGDPTATVRFR